MTDFYMCSRIRNGYRAVKCPCEVIKHTCHHESLYYVDGPHFYPGVPGLNGADDSFLLTPKSTKIHTEVN